MDKFDLAYVCRPSKIMYGNMVAKATFDGGHVQL